MDFFTILVKRLSKIDQESVGDNFIRFCRVDIFYLCTRQHYTSLSTPNTT